MSVIIDSKAIEHSDRVHTIGDSYESLSNHFTPLYSDSNFNDSVPKENTHSNLEEKEVVPPPTENKTENQTEDNTQNQTENQAEENMEILLHPELTTSLSGSSMAENNALTSPTIHQDFQDLDTIDTPNHLSATAQKDSSLSIEHNSSSDSANTSLNDDTSEADAPKADLPEAESMPEPPVDPDAASHQRTEQQQTEQNNASADPLSAPAASASTDTQTQVLEDSAINAAINTPTQEDTSTHSHENVTTLPSNSSLSGSADAINVPTYVPVATESSPTEPSPTETLTHNVPDNPPTSPNIPASTPNAEQSDALQQSSAPDNSQKILSWFQEGVREVVAAAKESLAYTQHEAQHLTQAVAPNNAQPENTNLEIVTHRLREIIGRVLAQRSAIIHEIQQDVIDIIITIAHKIVGKISTEDRNVVIENVTKSLSLLTTEQAINIRVHPEDFQISEIQLKKLTERLEKDKNVNFHIDPTMEKGGCIIETDAGSIDARISIQLSALEQQVRASNLIRTH